ncbi:MAG TPA: type II secretion system F family protein [Nevskiaceae bacterium]|nr:type II secretion system F family protein [Nevskiaceae bacterium]
MSPQTFAILVAMSVLLLAAGGLAFAVWLLQARGAGRLQTRLQGGTIGDEFAVAQAQPWLTSLARRGRRIERMLENEGESEKLLIQAGWRDAGSRIVFYAGQAGLPIAAIMLSAGLWVSASARPILLVFYTAALLVVSLLGPMWILRRVAAARRQRIKNEVPLFIHLLVLLFEAGLSTRQAIASLVREGRGVLPELGREFELVLRSLEAGGDTAEVLRGLGEAMDVSDLSGVLTVLRQVDRYGGEIREPLSDMMQILEERRDLDLRESVNRTSAKMTWVMVGFFFPALLIFVAGPAFISIIRALGEVTGR